MLDNRWSQLARPSGGKAPDVDWVGVQREIEVGLQRRLRRELQVEPLIICLVQPAPAGTPAYKGRADAEPDTRPAPRPRGGRDGGRERGSRELVLHGSAGASATLVATPEAAASPQVVAAAAPVVAAVPAPSTKAAAAPAIEEREPEGRTRRRRSAAAS